MCICVGVTSPTQRDFKQSTAMPRYFYHWSTFCDFVFIQAAEFDMTFQSPAWKAWFKQTCQDILDELDEAVRRVAELALFCLCSEFFSRDNSS